MRDNLSDFSIGPCFVRFCPLQLSVIEETKLEPKFTPRAKFVTIFFCFYRSLFRAFLSAAIFRHLMKQKWHKMKTADSIFVLLNVDVSAGHV
jgi:hypothetical protein